MTRWTEEQMTAFHKLKNEMHAASHAVSTVDARPKYRNKKTMVDGKKFDSKLEARRYCQLIRLQECGIISNLKCQVRYPLEINGQLICHYVADFSYRDIDQKEIVEDAKGVRTRDYIIKKKLMLAIHGIRVKEFRKERGGAGKS